MHNHPSSLKRLITIFLLIFIDSLTYFLVIPVLLRIFIHNDGGLFAHTSSIATRDTLYSVAVMISMAAFLICSPFIGYLSDRFGRKKVLFGCLCGSLIGFILPIVGILTKHLSYIFIGRFIAGGASGSQPVAQAAITDFTTGKQKAFYLSMIAFAMTLAMSLGPLIGSYFSDSSICAWFTIATPYWLGALLAGLNIVFLICFFFETPSLRETKRPSLRESASDRSNLPHRIILLMLIFFLLEFAWSDYYQSIFLYFPKVFHYSTDAVGNYAAYIGFWMCIGLTVIYKLILRYLSLNKILFTSLLLITAAFVACTLFPTPTTHWLAVIFIAVFVGIGYASLLALMSENTAPNHQGLILGIASFLLGIAWMITSLLTGWLIHVLTNWIMLTASLAMLTALITCLSRPQAQ